MQEINNKKSRIKRNISIFLKANGISDYEFYKNSGITRGILSQNNGISEENLLRFLAYAPEVNVDWLLSGQGKMLKSDVDEQTNIVGDISESKGKVNVSQPTTKEDPADTAALRAQLATSDRLVESLRAQLEEKERVIQTLQALANEKQKLIDLLER